MEFKIKNKAKTKKHLQNFRFRYFQTIIGGGLHDAFLKADFKTGKTYLVIRSTGHEEDLTEDLSINTLLSPHYIEVTKENNRLSQYGYPLNLKPADCSCARCKKYH